MNLDGYEEAQRLIRKLTLERDALRKAAETAMKAIERAGAAQKRAEARVAELESQPGTSTPDITSLRARLEESEAENQRLRGLLGHAGQHRPAQGPADRKPELPQPLIDPFTSLGADRSKWISTWDQQASGGMTARL